MARQLTRDEAHRLAAAVLGIQPGAALHVARRAYLARVGEAHPDRAGGSHGAFLAVQTAWEVCQVLAECDAEVIVLPGSPAAMAVPAPTAGPYRAFESPVGRLVDLAV